jgi:GNAT superfamily N-acetyltransferase
MVLEIRKESLESEAATRLIGALNIELRGAYPEPGANHFRLDSEEVGEGRGAFVVAYEDGRAVGCGGLRKLDEETGELKRMYVTPEARGKGIGKAVLAALEAEARRLGVERVVLETGIRQTAAAAMYRRAGYLDTAPYGQYVASTATSLCMAKEL